MNYVLLTLLFIFGCTGGGDVGFVPDNATTLEEADEALRDPIIDSVSLVPSFYGIGSSLNIQVTFLKKMFVTNGIPFINLDIGGVNVQANYLSGSGTKNHIYQYNIQPGDQDSDGIIINSPIDINGGLILDILDQNAITTFLTPDTSSVIVDTIVPTVNSIITPLNQTYGYNENLDFQVNFSEQVYVIGTPSISLDIGGVSANAQYISGSSTNTLIFRKTVSLNELDNNGINITLNSINLNGGSLKDIANNDSDLNFIIPDTSGVLVDGVIPHIISSTTPTNGSYTTGTNLDFSFTFNETVNVIGTPSFNISIGATSRTVNYLSGTGTNTLNFRYTVLISDIDQDGISSNSSINLNGGSIKGIIGDDALLSFIAQDLSNILINSSAATQLEFTSIPATNQLVNTNFSVNPRVEIKDSFGNTKTNRTDSITISAFTDALCLLPSSSTIQTTTNPVTASLGVSNFTNTRHLKNETLYLKAEASGLTSDCSSAINFSNRAPSLNLISDQTISQLSSITSINAEDSNSLGGTDKDIDGDTLTYTCYYDTSDNNAVANTTLCNSLTGLSFNTTTGVLSWTTTAAHDGTYEFKISASDTLLISDSIFTINVTDISPPAAPTNPILSSTWVTGNNPLSSPSFTWTNPGTDFSNAEVSLGTTAGAVNIVNWIDSNNVAEHTFTGLTLIECQTYFPNVRAEDSNANSSSAISHPIGFTYDNSAPSAVVVNNIANDTTATKSATVSWDATTENCSFDHYEIAISATTLESGIIAGGGFVDIGTNLSGSTPSLTLSPGVDYHTLIKAIDSAGLESNITASAAWRYIIPPDTITNLDTASKSEDSIELSWTTPNDNGTAITDYILEYKLSADSVWIVVNDGVSTDTNITVTGLNDSSSYDFRVRSFNGTSYSLYSNTHTEETPVNHPFFDPTVYQALNLGGAEASAVVAFQDTTTVNLNGVFLQTLNAGQVFNFTSNLNDIISADKPIFVAGRRGAFGAGATSKGNITWNTPDWAGKEFLFSGSRNPEHVYTVYAFENSTVTITRNGALQATQFIAADSAFTFRFATNGSYHVTSTGTITGYVYSENTTNNLVIDPYPVLPISKDIIGFPSNRAQIGSTTNGNTTNYYHSNSNTALTTTLNTANFLQINPTGGTTSLYQSNALRIIASEKITGRSNADANGNCSASFIPTSTMRKKYALNVEAEWIAFASTSPGTITVIAPGGGTSTLTLTKTGTDPNSPYKVRAVNLSAGHRFESTVRMGAWYEPKTDSFGSNDDETVMFGTDD